jgi:hypothetical protein
MMKEEKESQKYFQKMKDDIRLLFPRGWKNQFKTQVDNFINERLEEAKSFLEIPCKVEEEEERTNLHRIRRLVAGAFQEWELVQQPAYAAECAEADDALVWQGRGYVDLTRLLFLDLNHLPRIHLKKFRQQYGW